MPGAWSDHLPVRRPLEDLFWAWLDRGRLEVSAYLANNGDEPPDPRRVAEACPSLNGRAELAAWHLATLETRP
jgi:hypothetical protein